MSKKVLVTIADGIEEIEAVCIIDTLVRAGADVTVASVDGIQVAASRGVKLVADMLISDCADLEYDLIALPGGMPGAEHLRDCKELATMLKAQAQAGRLYGAICASPAVVLAEHGLLDGKKATCYPSVGGKIEKYVDQRVVVDGNCVTSCGPGSAIEFALVLAGLLCGQSVADEVAKGMLVD